MKIKIQSEDELLSIAAEAIHIVTNLRAATKKYNEHFGSHLKNRKIYWENKADELVERLQVPEHRNLNELKIEINGEDKVS